LRLDAAAVDPRLDLARLVVEGVGVFGAEGPPSESGERHEAREGERAAVTVEGERVAEIGRGLLLLVGAGREDREGEVDRLADKIATLRIFEDGAGKMNLALR